MSGVFALLLVWLTVPLVGCYGCPNHCLCYTWRGLVRTDCVQRNLFNTFVGFSHQTQVLDLSYNVITILHGNEFLDANLRYLQDLRLSNNRLYQVDKLSFNGLKLLQNLDLSHNSIEYLNPSTFKNNPHLKSLNISFNPLSVKKYESFLSSTLQFLDMTDCRLQFVTPRMFLDLKQLIFLNISRNNIREIELEFLSEVKTLKYLDISKNDFSCNDHISAFLRSLVSRKIEFRIECKRSQKIKMMPIVDAKEIGQLESELQASFRHNATPKTPQDEHTILNDVIQFFRSIPSFYAAVCGVHFGVLIGSFSTYICLKKFMRKYKSNADLEGTVEERTLRHGNSDCDIVNFPLIPLNIPPGTPPSPYHSRFFPASFSLSAT